MTRGRGAPRGLKGGCGGVANLCAQAHIGELVARRCRGVGTSRVDVLVVCRYERDGEKARLVWFCDYFARVYVCCLFGMYKVGECGECFF